jgi:hypothetical protein
MIQTIIIELAFLVLLMNNDPINNHPSCIFSFANGSQFTFFGSFLVPPQSDQGGGGGRGLAPEACR